MSCCISPSIRLSGQMTRTDMTRPSTRDKERTRTRSALMRQRVPRPRSEGRLITLETAETRSMRVGGAARRSQGSWPAAVRTPARTCTRSLLAGHRHMTRRARHPVRRMRVRHRRARRTRPARWAVAHTAARAARHTGCTRSLGAALHHRSPPRRRTCPARHTRSSACQQARRPLLRPCRPSLSPWPGRTP